MTDMRRTLAKAQDKGINGDTILAHINPMEAALLKAIGGSGTRNPKTGLLQFDFGDGSMSDPGGGGFGGYGGGGDFGGSGGASNDGYLPGEPVALPGGVVDMGPVNPGTFNPGLGGASDAPQMQNFAQAPVMMPDYQEQAFAAQHQGRNVGQRVADWGTQQVRDMAANPARTGVNAMASFVPGVGVLNTLSGLLFGPEYTIGGGVTSLARNATNYDGKQTGVAAGAAPESESRRDDAATLGGESGGASGDGGPLSSMAPRQSFGGTPALANAIAGNSPFQNGRITFGPLVDSYAPNGRRYVTPWAMRG